MPRRQAIKRTRPPIPGWLWLLGGAVIGALLAVTVMLTGGLPGEEEEWRGPRPVTPQADADGPPQPDSPGVIPERDYDFYTVLPEMEVVIPAQELNARAQQAPDVPAEPGARYMLQAGSFQGLDEADRLKAQLALQGFVARIQTVTVNSDTWHRVRLGPFDNYRTLQDAQQRLEAEGIASIALKVKN